MTRWSKYYFEMCNVVASNSTCHSNKIGAILVRDKSIIATGYNGPPRGVPHCGKERFSTDPFLRDHATRSIDPTYIDVDTCPRRLMGFASGDGLQYCIATHAEQNCIANAAREGVCTKGATMYVSYKIPCKDCMAVLINAGVLEIVVNIPEYYDPEAEFLVRQGGVSVRDFEGRYVS